MDEQPHVVIIGGGFGGLWATRALARCPVRITLIDRTNHHLFQPLLYQVATAGLSPADIAAPLRHILRRQRNVSVRLDEVQRIDLGQRRLLMRNGDIGYDYLIVAAGASHAYFGNDQWADDAPGLKTIEDALLMRKRMLHAFEAAEREDDPEAAKAWLRFAVVGAGPTGVELAGTLAEIARHTLPSEFRHADPRAAEVHLIEAGPRVLSHMAESLSSSARQQLERLGVTVHLNSPVSAIDADSITHGGQTLRCRTVWWAAGVAASKLGAQLSDQLDRAGRVPVQTDLSLPDHPEVFVIGDLATLAAHGKAVPGVAPAAKQMGNHAAAMIRARLAGKPGTAFRYRNYGDFATIGRMAAVVDVRGFRLRGLFAWWLWLAAHVFFLIGFRNRLVVLLNWAFSYFTYQRHARILSLPRRSAQRLRR
jgi:NADH dehydrogenase